MRTVAVCCEEPKPSPITIPFGVGRHCRKASGEEHHRRASGVARNVKQKVCTAFCPWRPALLRAGYGRLADGNRGTLLPIATLNRSGIRLTPIDRDLLKDVVPVGHLLPLAFYPAISHTQRRYGYHRQRWKATGISRMCWPLLPALWTSHFAAHRWAHAHRTRDGRKARPA
jgi:hypothetical protein